MLKRYPRGYVGTRHETLGSDIIAVRAVCTLPRQVLGEQITDALEQVKPDLWYPIEILLNAMDVLADKVGYMGLLQMGRQLFRLSHAERLKATARAADDIVFGIDAMYRHANRGTGIGGWRVLSFQPGQATLEKTTPHHCWMEEGILSEAFAQLGIPAFVKQTSCFRNDADSCVYEIGSVVRDQRWMGSRSPVRR